MRMTNFNVDPQAVINDLLDQIKKLTADNSILRAALQSLTAAPPAPEDDE